MSPGLQILIRQSLHPDTLDYRRRVEDAGSALVANLRPVDQLFRRAEWEGLKPSLEVGAALLLAGPETLAGALVPMYPGMPVPTNFNFVAGDYNRAAGLVGDGAGKYLNSGRNNNAEAQNSRHLAVWRSVAEGTGNTQAVAGVSLTTSGQTTLLSTSNTNKLGRVSDVRIASQVVPSTVVGLWAVARSGSNQARQRYGGIEYTNTEVSLAPSSENILIFARLAAEPQNFTTARIAYYSIGADLSLAALDATITAYMAALV
jgi:hypothetical protein